MKRTPEDGGTRRRVPGANYDHLWYSIPPAGEINGWIKQFFCDRSHRGQIFELHIPETFMSTRMKDKNKGCILKITPRNIKHLEKRYLEIDDEESDVEEDSNNLQSDVFDIRDIIFKKMQDDGWCGVDVTDPAIQDYNIVLYINGVGDPSGCIWSNINRISFHRMNRVEIATRFPQVTTCISYYMMEDPEEGTEWTESSFKLFRKSHDGSMIGRVAVGYLDDYSKRIKNDYIPVYLTFQPWARPDFSLRTSDGIMELFINQITGWVDEGEGVMINADHEEIPIENHSIPWSHIRKTEKDVIPKVAGYLLDLVQRLYSDAFSKDNYQKIRVVPSTDSGPISGIKFDSVYNKFEDSDHNDVSIVVKDGYKLFIMNRDRNIHNLLNSIRKKIFKLLRKGNFEDKVPFASRPTAATASEDLITVIQLDQDLTILQMATGYGWTYENMIQYICNTDEHMADDRVETDDDNPYLYPVVSRLGVYTYLMNLKLLSTPIKHVLEFRTKDWLKGSMSNMRYGPRPTDFKPAVTEIDDELLGQTIQRHLSMKLDGFCWLPHPTINAWKVKPESQTPLVSLPNELLTEFREVLW